MFLARALRNIYTLESDSDRRKVLIETLKNPEKIAKMLLRIEFLTACRRERVHPRCIQEALQPVQKVFEGTTKVISKCRSFAHILLNESIAEADRRKTYLARQRNRLFTSIHSFLDDERLSYGRSTFRKVFDITIDGNRPRLVQKFQRHQREEFDCYPKKCCISCEL